MARAPKLTAGGGWHAVRYTMTIGRRVGFLRLWRSMRSRNACKTCALGMGGQKGGMVNELGRFPEVCKKSLQAMAADMQGPLPEAFAKTYSVAQLQTLSPRELETAGRLVQPLFKAEGATHFRPLPWDEALAKISDKLRATPPEQSFFYFSGRSSNEAGFLLNLLARVYGTNHVNNCSYYCHQASGVGLGSSIGTGTATVRAEDLDKADLFFLIGGNPASNHPRLMTHLMHLRRRGGRVVVVNPVKETGLVRFRIPSDPWSLLFGTKIASDYVQVRIGGDIAFLMGVAKALVERGEGLAEDFLAKATEGWTETRHLLSAVSWSDLEAGSGTDRQSMEEIAALYARSERVIFGWTMGITHHEHGVQNVHWIVNLALMRGMVGKASAGLLPIRGHSNVQGMGTLGVTPALREAVLKRFEASGLEVPKMAGLDTMGCMDAAHAGRLRFGMALGGNLYGSNPDSTYAAEALGKLDLMVYLNTSLNTGHAHGLGRETLILPVLARDEEPYKTTQESMFNYVRLSDGGPARHEGPRGEVDLIAELGSRLMGEQGAVPWSRMHDAAEVRRWIAKLIPGFEALQGIDATKAEFVIPGRTLDEPRFPTPSGRARMHAHPMPPPPPAGELRLMTVRSEGQFNTVVYEEEDLYRNQERRDVILMHARDMERLGLREDQPVMVKNDTGTAGPVLARAFDIREGNALMYCPEANVLVPRRLDPLSKTPAFKSVVVSVTPAAASGSPVDRREARLAPPKSGLSRALKAVLNRRARPRPKAC